MKEKHGILLTELTIVLLIKGLLLFLLWLLFFSNPTDQNLDGDEVSEKLLARGIATQDSLSINSQFYHEQQSSHKLMITARHTGFKL